MDKILSMINGDALIPPHPVHGETIEIFVKGDDGDLTLVAFLPVPNDPIVWGIMRENAQKMIHELSEKDMTVKVTVSQLD